jgi:hypothetical protein
MQNGERIEDLPNLDSKVQKAEIAAYLDAEAADQKLADDGLVCWLTYHVQGDGSMILRKQE